MITWQYRVFREADGGYLIREVFYDNGALVGCTESAVEPMGESLEELAQDIESFKDALKLPVLTFADIPKPPRKKRDKDRSKYLTSDQVRAALGLDKRTTNGASHKNSKRKNAVTSGARKRNKTGVH